MGDSITLTACRSPSTSQALRWTALSVARLAVQDVRGVVKYVGGEHYLDRVPLTFRFADLAHRLSEKANHSVSLRYQVPGEALDEDELVAISDNLDVEVCCAGQLLLCDPSVSESVLPSGLSTLWSAAMVEELCCT